MYPAALEAACVSDDVGVANQWCHENGMLVNNEGKRHQGIVHGDADYGFPFPPEDTLEIFGMEIIFPNIYQMCEKRFINSLI